MQETQAKPFQIKKKSQSIVVRAFSSRPQENKALSSRPAYATQQNTAFKEIEKIGEENNNKKDPPRKGLFSLKSTPITQIIIYKTYANCCILWKKKTLN